MEGTIDLKTGGKATQSVSKPIECAKIFFVTKSKNTRRLPMANIEKKKKRKEKKALVECINQNNCSRMPSISILILAKLQNTGPLVYILLNHNSAYCVPLRSSKDFDTCKTGGPKWPCIL